MREVFLLLQNSMMLFILQVFIASGRFDALYDEKLANWKDEVEKGEEMFVSLLNSL